MAGLTIAQVLSALKHVMGGYSFDFADEYIDILKAHMEELGCNFELVEEPDEYFSIDAEASDDQILGWLAAKSLAADDFEARLTDPMKGITVQSTGDRFWGVRYILGGVRAEVLVRLCQHRCEDEGCEGHLLNAVADLIALIALRNDEYLERLYTRAVLPKIFMPVAECLLWIDRIKVRRVRTTQAAEAAVHFKHFDIAITRVGDKTMVFCQPTSLGLFYERIKVFIDPGEERIRQQKRLRQAVPDEPKEPPKFVSIMLDSPDMAAIELALRGYYTA